MIEPPTTAKTKFQMPLSFKFFLIIIFFSWVTFIISYICLNLQINNSQLLNRKAIFDYFDEIENFENLKFLMDKGLLEMNFTLEKLSWREIVQTRNIHTEPNCSALRTTTLFGLKLPKTDPPSLHEMKKLLSTKGLKNGCFIPQDCNDDSNQKLLIIIPYRDRPGHLPRLLLELHQFLIRQRLNYCIVVSEQNNKGSFSFLMSPLKGILMNAGFDVMTSKSGLNDRKDDFTCIVFHDVDLIPEDDRNLYICNETNPTHLSIKIKKFKYIYPYGTDFGGVTMIPKSLYKKLNGHTNLFWGWGQEDTDMQQRITKKRISIDRPDNLDYGKYTNLEHDHDYTFQNSKRSIGIEDARTVNLRSSLMWIRNERAIHDGLNNLGGRYRIVDNSIHRSGLYRNLSLDLELASWENIQVYFDGKSYFDMFPSTHRVTNSDSLNDVSCTYKTLNSTTISSREKLKTDFKQFQNKYDKTLDLHKCSNDPYCYGLALDTNILNNHTSAYILRMPILMANNTDVNTILKNGFKSFLDQKVVLKICNNDLYSWQIMPKVIPKLETNIIKLKFLAKIHQNFFSPKIPIYYRDSWMFEGHHIDENNIFIDRSENSTQNENFEFRQHLRHLNNTAFEQGDFEKTHHKWKIGYKELQKFGQNSNLTEITVQIKLIHQLSPGHYNLLSKIVDAFGQPYLEINFNFIVSRDPESFSIEKFSDREIDVFEMKKFLALKKKCLDQKVSLDGGTWKFKNDIRKAFNDYTAGLA